jgi:ATP-dependent DNA helicase RecQ
MLTKPFSVPDPQSVTTRERPDDSYDEGLFNMLRQLRKTLADERDVPAYVIFSDVSLRQMARDYPTNEQDFLQISGVGSRKLEEFGTKFLAAIAEHVETHQSPPPSSQPRKSYLSVTAQETLHLFRKGISTDQITKELFLKFRRR